MIFFVMRSPNHIMEVFLLLKQFFSPGRTGVFLHLKAPIKQGTEIIASIPCFRFYFLSRSRFTLIIIPFQLKGITG